VRASTRVGDGPWSKMLEALTDESGTVICFYVHIVHL